jgi:hypothetical protein
MLGYFDGCADRTNRCSTNDAPRLRVHVRVPALRGRPLSRAAPREVSIDAMPGVCRQSGRRAQTGTRRVARQGRGNPGPPERDTNLTDPPTRREVARRPRLRGHPGRGRRRMAARPVRHTGPALGGSSWRKREPACGDPDRGGLVGPATQTLAELGRDLSRPFRRG